MAANTVNIPELLKKAKLYNPNTLPQVQDQGNPPELSPSGTTNPDDLRFATQDVLKAGQAIPQPISEKEKALSSYRQAMQEHMPSAPSQSDYSPSVGRRIIGALLGGTVGAFSDPKSGGQLANNIVSAPYNKALNSYNQNSTDYQRKLAQKKEAYEAESGDELQQAKVGELGEQNKAEVARAGFEEANKARELALTRGMQPGTPEFEGKMKELQVQYPDARFNKPPTPYTLELNNGEKIVGYEDKDGQFKDSEGNIYGPKTFKSAFKVGTEPKVTPPREGEAGYIDKFTKEQGREPTSAEQLKIHKDWESSGRKETSVDPDAAAFRREYQMTNAKNTANKQYATQLSQASQHLEKIDQARTLIASGNPESIALTVPNVLTALISGQGTGVRITQAEMNNIIHARGWGESVEAMVKKISGQGSLSSKQRQDLAGILDDVKSKVNKKQKILSDTMDKIDNADSPSAISKAHIEHRKKTLSDASEANSVTTSETGTVNSKDPLGILK